MNKEEFGRLLLAAQHQDKIRGWPWIGRFIHWLLASWRRPARLRETELIVPTSKKT